MGNMKRRLAVFLSILFILPSILSVLPQTAEDVQAGNSVLVVALGGMFTSSSGGKPAILSVEEGQQFYIGDYMKLYLYDKKGSHEIGTMSMVKASYSSSDISVAEVNSKGLVSAKAEGTTIMEMKYKGGRGVFELQVVKSGSFGEKEAYTKVKQAIDKLMKNCPSKVTSKNAFQMLKKMKAYQAACAKFSSEISESGFTGSNRYKLAVPQAGRFNMYQQMLTVYADNNSPLATTSSKVLRVESIKATRKKVEVTLKNAPTIDQFLSLKISYNMYPSEKNRTASKNKVYFNIYLADKKGMWTTGLACMTKGSRKLVITPQQYKNGNQVNGSLKKGTYTLGSTYEWTKGKKFKVK